MRARSSTGWTSGAATYDSGFETHKHNRPAPRCSAPLSGLVLDSHLAPSPVASTKSQNARQRRAWPSAASPNSRNLQHNHARYDAFGKLASEVYSSATTSPCMTCYLSPDHLGTPRLVTDASANVIARHDYL